MLYISQLTSIFRLQNKITLAVTSVQVSRSAEASNIKTQKACTPHSKFTYGFSADDGRSLGGSSLSCEKCFRTGDGW